MPVNWYRNRVVAKLKDADEKILDALAMQTLGQARINIRENKQIDTGFMTNSGYVVSARNDNYNETWPTGEYKRTKAPGTSYGELAAKASVRKAIESVVAFGAHYSIFQEMRRSFLYQAVQDVSKSFGAIVSEEKF